MYSCALAVFVKTPEHSPVKTRLAREIGEELAREFYHFSVDAVKATVAQAAKDCQAITPFWAVAEEKAVRHPMWRDFATITQGEGSLGERLHRVYERLIVRFDSVVLIGADSPQIDKDVLIKTATQLGHELAAPFFVGPAKDGGFYLFGGRRILSQATWTGVRYSCAATCSELVGRLEREDSVTLLPRLSDVDERKDLLQLHTDLGRCENQTPEQEQLFKWITTHDVSDAE